MTRTARFALAALALAAAATAVYTFRGGFPAGAVIEWMRQSPRLGVGLFAIVYVLATLLLGPASLLTAAAGFVYGPVGGSLLVPPVSLLAATLALFLGRSVARGWVSRQVARHPRLAALDRAIAECGFRMVLLLRLSPVFPFGVLNYALGVTTVRARDYLWASFLGMLPATLLYVYLGSLAGSVGELVSRGGADAGTWGQALKVGGLLATLLAVLLVVREVRRALRQALDGGAACGMTVEGVA